MKNNLAFKSGCDLWVVINNPESYWWKEIDFKSAFLFSSLKKHSEGSFTQASSAQVEAVLKETEFPKFNFKSGSKLTFVGTQNHFLNRWICLIENPSDIDSEDFIKSTQGLGFQNIRFFFEIKLSARFKARFPNAEFISDSH